MPNTNVVVDLYHALLNSIDQGFCTLEVAFDANEKPLDYRFLEVSPSFEGQTGIADAAGRWMREIAPDQDDHWAELYGRVALTGESARFESHSTPLKRTWSVYAFRIGEPQLRRVGVLFDDITGRKRREVRRAFVEEVTQDLMQSSSVHEIMDHVGEKIGRHLQLTTCNFCEVQESRGELTVTHSWNDARVPNLRTTYRIGDYLSNELVQACRAGEAVVIHDTSADDRTDTRVFGDLKIAAFVAIPFHREGEWKGLLSVTDSKRREWRAGDVELVRELANRIFPRAERARAEERYLALFNAIDQGFCTLEVAFDANDKALDYRFVEVSPSFERQTGIANGAGRWMREIAPDHDEHWFETYGRVALTGAPARFESASTPLGRWWSVYAFRVGEPHERTVAVLFSDITERKKAEEALRRSEESLREADRRKDEFLATLGHELRNPLAPIRNGLEVLKLAKNNPQLQEQACQIMERQLGHMVRLVDDLLDVSRISRGRIELRKTPADLNAIVRLAFESSKPMIEANAQEVVFITSAEPVMVVVDATRIAQVLSNLFDNAAKYTPRGGRITVTVAREGDDALVSVSDTGIGIPSAKLSQIFEMFTQLDVGADRTQSGLGIGLTLAKRLVELHEGTVSASSEGVDRGSTFVVRLPAQG